MAALFSAHDVTIYPLQLLGCGKNLHLWYLYLPFLFFFAQTHLEIHSLVVLCYRRAMSFLFVQSYFTFFVSFIGLPGNRLGQRMFYLQNEKQSIDSQYTDPQGCQCRRKEPKGQQVHPGARRSKSHIEGNITMHDIHINPPRGSSTLSTPNL